MSTKTQSNQKSDLRTVGVLADYSKANNQWLDSYGYKEVPIPVTDFEGKNVICDSGAKIILQRHKSTNQDAFRCWMPQSQPFIPHEAVQDITEKLTKNAKGHDGKPIECKILKVRDSHRGLSRFWLIGTNIYHTIKNSHEKKEDKMQLGFMIRNGYNTKIALGLDAFTFRLICSNGAIARGKDMGSASIRHVGKDPIGLLKLFETAMLDAIETSVKWLDFYDKLTEVKLNQKIAEHLYNSIHMPDKYFPETFDIAEPKEVKKGKPVVTLKPDGHKDTLWKAFNDMTQPLWHNLDPHKVKIKDKEVVKDGISFYTVARREMNLHRSMEYILENRQRFR